MSWTTIESDPGVFTSLVDAFGVKDVEVAEIMSLDAASLQALEPLHGIIFLFKYDASIPDDRTALTYASGSSIYFANQVINNACATQALVHVLLNADGVELGSTLTDFKSFTAAFPPEIRGESLEAADAIRTAHNSFARAEPFVAETRSSGEDDDAFHFVAFVPSGGKVYELDGLKPGPIEVGTVAEGEPWWASVTTEIQRRVALYAASELRFALMGVCKAQAAVAREGLEVAEARLAALAAADGGDAAAGQGSDLGDFDIGGTVEERAAQAAAVAEEQTRLQGVLEVDAAKRAAWAKENARRQHNYIPLALALFGALADKGQLMPLYEEAQKKAADARERAVERRAKRKATAAAAAVTP